MKLIWIQLPRYQCIMCSEKFTATEALPGHISLTAKGWETVKSGQIRHFPQTHLCRHKRFEALEVMK